MLTWAEDPAGVTREQLDDLLAELAAGLVATSISSAALRVPCVTSHRLDGHGLASRSAADDGRQLVEAPDEVLRRR